MKFFTQVTKPLRPALSLTQFRSFLNGFIVGFLEKEDLSQRMKKLFAQVDDLKGEINQAVNDRYVHFKPSLDTMGELKGRVTGIERDVSELKKTLKVCTKQTNP